jgi:hypothetical protein
VDIADADFFTRAHDQGQLLDVLRQLADGWPSPATARPASHRPPPPATAGHRPAPHDH